MYILNLTLLFFASFLLSFILVRWFRKKFLIWNLVDKPSVRRIHHTSIPRGGGVGFIITLIISLMCIEYCAFNNVDTAAIKILIPTAFIAIVSFVDDIRTLPITVRLLAHITCASYVVYQFLLPKTLFHGELPESIDLVLMIVGLVAFLNIYNFLDGIDGITGLESIHISITLIILCYLKYDVILHVHLIITIAVIILAFSIAFLIFNWHPATIFIGDVGSIGLGFIIGFCLLLLSVSSWHLFASSTIACLYYLADGGITILTRLMNGEKIWEPHLKHFFQKAVKNGYTQKQVLLRISACNFLLMLLSINALFNPATSMVLAMLVTGITLINFVK